MDINDIKRFLFALGKGILFGFIAFIITGDGASGVAGLLVTYIELKFGKKESESKRAKIKI